MENGSSEGSDPSAFLTEILGSNVKVKLNSGAEYTGLLSSIDGYMNLAMEGTKEFIEGSLRKDYGDCFIRGNNVMYISAA